MNNEANNNLNGNPVNGVSNLGTQPTLEPINPVSQTNNLQSSVNQNANPGISQDVNGVNNTPANGMRLGDVLNNNIITPINNDINSSTGPTTGTFFNDSSLNSSVQNNVPGDSTNSSINNFDNNGVNNNQTVDNETQQNSVSTELPGQPSVEPTPFINPQTIGTGPIPGFENPNNIGTTPPISLESEKEPQKNPNKTNKIAFIIIVIAVLAAVGFGVYYILNYTNLLNKNTITISIETNELEINVGTELSENIDDYATITGTASTNCAINTENVDINTPGTYEYEVICGETKKSGTITVIDDGPLEVALKSVYKVTGETIIASEFAKDVNDGLSYEFVDSESVNSLLSDSDLLGQHIIKIKVSKNNKSVEVDATLVIVEHEIKGFLTCSSNPQNIPDTNAQMTVSEKFAISDTETETNVYGGIAYEVYIFAFSDENEYKNYLTQYNTDKALTINGISSDNVEFDNEQKTITFTKELTEEQLVSEYGKENIAKYSTILSYFRQTLGYNCSFKR